MIAVSFTTFRETYGPLILKKRAQHLRRETGNQQYYTVFERLEEKKAITAILGRTLTRPLRLLAFHPIIQVASLLSAFYYGMLYIVLTSFATLWTDKYHQSVEISGLHYIACALGEVAGSQVGGSLMDRMYRSMLMRSGTDGHVPEYRLPLIIPVAILAPLGLLVYGWTAQYHVHWIVVDVGVFIYMFASQVVGMPLQAYVIDAYAEHASSALAAEQFLNSMAAFLFPLFVPTMYNALGYGWGNTTLAFIGLCLGVPAPLAMYFWGAKLRARATSSY
jgi:hypothetical protein